MEVWVTFDSARRTLCALLPAVALLLGASGSASAPSTETSSPPAASESGLRTSPPKTPADRFRGTIDLAFAGDMNFGRSLGQRLLAEPDHDPFVAMRSIWARADLRFANLESVLADLNGETESKTKHLVFAGPPAAARTLRLARVDVVSTANNHAWDYGRKALIETLSLLDAEGVGHAGSGPTRSASNEPFLTTIGGRRIAILAFTGVWNQGRLAEHPARTHVADGAPSLIAEEVARHRGKVELLFVSYHGGEEYSDVPVEYVRRAARAAMEAGADAFIGHHPHVPEGVEFTGGRPIFYSLGNLVFAKVKSSPWSDLGLVARVTHTTEGTLTVRMCPVTIGSYLPRPLASAPPDVRAEGLRHLRRLSRRFDSLVGDAFDDEGCVGVSPAARAPDR